MSAAIVADHRAPRSERLRMMFNAIRFDISYSRQVQQVIPGYIEHGAFRSAAAFACLSIKPHVDLEFGPFTALWIMLANGHQLGFSATTPENPDAPQRGSHSRPRHRIEYEAVPEEIAVFNCHKLHWCTPGIGAFAAVSIDFKELPSHDEIEAEFIKRCRS